VVFHCFAPVGLFERSFVRLPIDAEDFVEVLSSPSDDFPDVKEDQNHRDEKKEKDPTIIGGRGRATNPFAHDYCEKNGAFATTDASHFAETAEKEPKSAFVRAQKEEDEIKTVTHFHLSFWKMNCKMKDK
jgi:hypothetical protein